MSDADRRSGRRASAPILVSAGLLLASSTPVHAGTLTGAVRNSSTNAMPSGVLVRVNQQPGRQATTNSSGVYRIGSVSAGSVTLALSKSGFVSAISSPITVPASGTVTVPQILLVLSRSIEDTVPLRSLIVVE